jgi:transcriptional regulator with XRE-family HTH domain
MITPGSRLQEFMRSNKLNQKTLALKSGIGQASISRMINNEQPITLNLIKTLYELYNLNPVFLIDEKVKMNYRTDI